MVGDERSALQAVVAADVELLELREEEEQLNKQLQDTSLEDKPKDFHADEASERLNEVSAACLPKETLVVLNISWLFEMETYYALHLIGPQT